MDDRPQWFAPKRYGFGSGLPVAWQGWLVLAIYTILIAAAVLLFGDKPLPLLAIVIPSTLLLLLICARTTRGGWRWRWGGDDQ